ncbi:hypothetical protein FDP41_003233 [Naegleria fowleri]|uniref:Iron-binding zinc finger CDGSH type domain-containing protein n=1 Tax=Naegleria fowleri TaxID=5763 RepID=A0A6A5BU48_NAEFO|nr:uncharacterized protein FDP41_003233 [Naegleria fowleri]KAF0977911.1 hypothetical protein FDP41_003233 [Naegleria fowleri]CAG4717060.1 unnamed protein product [Naegleria fowleri]
MTDSSPPTNESNLSLAKDQGSCCKNINHQIGDSSMNTTTNTEITHRIPNKPNIAMPCYKRIVLEVGVPYSYCTCGFSKLEGGAFCDGTCRNSDEIKGWEPKEFTVNNFNSGGYSICCCKRTKKPPFCDGSHIDLDW